MRPVKLYSGGRGADPGRCHESCTAGAVLDHMKDINGYSPRQVAAPETALHHRVMGSADASEGVAAFLERRPPRWTTSVSSAWVELPKR
jgi:hypothetical protein